MPNTVRQISRKLHLWIALAIFLPAVIVIGSGILLQLKKEADWIQPPTQKGSAKEPSIRFEDMLAKVATIPEMQATTWSQIARIDVQPRKGVVKIQATNHWEAQLDAQTGELLQVAYRRSDIIEAIHDGSWFADAAKLWVFLPAAILLFIIWCSGVVLLVTTLKSKYKKHAQHANRR